MDGPEEDGSRRPLLLSLDHLDEDIDPEVRLPPSSPAPPLHMSSAVLNRCEDEGGANLRQNPRPRAWQPPPAPLGSGMDRSCPWYRPDLQQRSSGTEGGDRGGGRGDRWEAGSGIGAVVRGETEQNTSAIWAAMAAPKVPR